ncbi:armadillo-type protein [Melampsora americana]|nr:armadillo-type protein [Melampsora americana]
MAEPTQDSEWQSLPVQDQLTHKLWKARLSAYETLIKQFELAEGDDDEVFTDWNRDSEWPKRAVTDSNAVAQEKGIYLVSVYIRLAGRPATRCRSDCITPLVEKSLATNSRKGTRDAGIECLLGWAMSEADGDKAEGIVTAVIEGLGSKQPKVVAGAVSALNALISAFGVKVINIKPILKSLAKIFAHADKGVRAEGTTLVHTLYKFLGPALEPSLSELKPVQVKELHESFAVLDSEGKGKGTGTPTRETAGQQRERLQREAQAALEGVPELGQGDPGSNEQEAETMPEEPEDIDPYDLAEPVTVLDRLPSGFFEHLASTKWKERKEEALDPLYEVLKTAIKIKPDHYDELVKALAGRMSDANILCVIGAANCLECLAKGLRTDFGKYKILMLVPMLEKFKERKVNVVEALSNCLDAMALTVTLPELTEDIVTFSKHKNPAVKEQTMKFLVRCLRNTEHQIPKQDVKPLSDVMLSGLEDAVVPVREISAEGLGTMMKLVGKATFSPLIQAQDDLRKAKVEEYFEKAVVKYKPPKAKPKPVVSKPAARPPPKARPAPKQSTPPSPDKNEFRASTQSKPPSKAPPKPAVKKAPAAIGTAPKKTASAAQPSAAPKGASKPIEEVRYKMSQEDAEARAPDCLDAAFIEGVNNSLWKTRLAALDDMLGWLPDHLDEVEAELLVRYMNKKPGPKESNFQVWQRVCAVLQFLAENSPSFSKACIALTVPSLIEKYGDGKIRESAGGALLTFAEKSSLGFVLSHAFEAISKQKAVKIQAESFVFIEMSLTDFGITGVPIRDLIECLKTGLKSVNAAVRTNATKALVTTKLCIGAGSFSHWNWLSDITNFLQDLNPQLLGTIEAEFAKIDGESPPVPTRESADVAQAKSGPAAKGKGKVAPGDDALDELFPRVDLDKLISSSVVKSCDDSAWKIRKEALETIQSILESNKRLKPNLGSDLTASLKLRLGDANKAVQALALDITGRIATGMGKPFERHAKMFATSMLMVLADKNAGARNNALTTLSAVADACGLDCLTASVAAALEIAKPELRASALTWIVQRLAEPDAVKGLDMSPFAAPLISCLEDRSPEVRKGAQELLPTVIQAAGIDIVLDQTSNLKPASRNNVVPMIEAYRPAAPVKAAAPKSAAAKNARPASSLNKSTNRASIASTQRASTPTLEDRPAPLKSKLGLRKPVGGPVSKLAPPPPLPASPGPVTSTSDVPFRSGDPKAKTLRASKETGPLRWVIEGAVRKDQIEQLHLQMSSQISGELLGQLFSKDHHCEKDFMAGLNAIESWTSDPSLASETADMEESDIRDRLLANADLVFKYLTIRLHDTNTSITMKCLDIIEQYITVLQLDAYRLTDYEASVLLPSLIGRCGDSKETLRTRIRAIFKHICSIYPFSKVFQSLLDHGIKSKNARVRAECAEELSALFQRHGLNVCQPAKALPLIASLISDRDSAVRNGALSALASAYSSAGDMILKYVGNLSGKEQDMLNERLKRTGAPASPKGTRPVAESAISPRPAAVSRLAPKTLRRPSSMGLQSITDTESVSANKGIPHRPMSTANTITKLASPSAMTHSKLPPLASQMSLRQSASRRNSLINSSLPAPRPQSHLSIKAPMNHKPIPPPASPSTSDHNANIPIAEILSSDDIRSTDALKVVQSDIANRPDSLIASADGLIDAIATQMRIAFENLDASTPPLTLRLCKHLMQTLSTFFDQSQLATAVSKDALVAVLAQLTQRLQETADNPVSEHITSLSKVLNMVLIRIFHNADRSACFGALFAVLKLTTIDMREIEGEVELAHRAKYAELVMKCLWKVSKTVKESLEDGTLDPRILLGDIDDFLVSIPPAEWRRRANDNVPLADMPLRTVKTILQQVVTIYGEGVYEAVSALKNPQDTFVYQYLFRLLNNSKAAAGEPPVSQPARRPVPLSPELAIAPRATVSSAMQQSPSRSPSRSRQSSAPSIDSNGPKQSPGPLDHFGEVNINNLLTEVFAKIGSPTESKKGIQELYQLLKLHPEANAKVDKWIGATGTYFQAYLRRALQNLRADDPDVAEDGAAVDSESVVPPLTPASRPNSNLISITPSPPVGSASEFAQQQHSARMTKAVSQHLDLNRLQTLFGFTNTNPPHQGHPASTTAEP